MTSEPKQYGGRYSVSGTIASGGMAEVFIAHDEMLNRPVALKILHPQFAKDTSFIERFRREAQAAASINDPRIVSIYDWGSDDGTYYIVMEYVEGKTLREIISSEGPLTPERAVEITADVCGALHLAHQKGIVHRDVKPANIAITKTGQTKVMDFGIARAAADGGQTMTQTGTVIGTANYFSPEQAQGLAVDARSDVYSAGVVLYEMLTREVPFKADTAVAIAYKHVKEDPVPPSALNAEIPAELDAIVMKALAKNPDNRYATAAEMQQDLTRLLRGDPVEATPLLPPDQTAMMQSADRTTVMPVEVTGSASPRRKAIAYALISAMFISLLILGLLGLYSLFGHNGAQVEVPDVRGQALEQAQKTLKALGLHGEVGSQDFSETVKEGSVISQDPEDGRKLAKGSSVSLVISKGAARVDVPDLVNKNKTEAEALLKAAGLELGAVNNTFNSEVPSGQILSQDPRGGQRVDRGSSVDVVISGGKQTHRVPNLVGLDEQSARSRLLDANLNPAVNATCNVSESNDKVLAQDPPPGTELEEGSTVTLSVNKTAKVPNVIGQSEASAKAELEAAGFKVEIIENDQPGDHDEVIKQDPSAGNIACKGDTVTITVII